MKLVVADATVTRRYDDNTFTLVTHWEAATGTAGGAFMPLVAGKLLDSVGLSGVFSMVAVMYAIFVISIQSVPETYGTSPDASPIDGGNEAQQAAASAPIQARTH